MPKDQTFEPRRPVGPALWRGIRGKCPSCGQTKLFRAYLKQVDACAVCETRWGEVRADDGPAWATILIVGHLIAPLLALAALTEGLPTWAAAGGLCVLAVILCLVILPRAKGAFIAIIWAKRADGSQ
ncbi:MAG: DUF983 domain-containing protein [Magnetovibrionaceae bacterium]